MVSNQREAGSLPDQERTLILIVDDDMINRVRLARVLEAHNYTVRAVADGIQAMAVAQEDQPDLILLDIMMPDPDGYTVCQQLKTSAPTRDIPIIFLSALDEVLDKVRAFSVGGVDYITKPFEVEEALARVRNQLTIRRAQAALQTVNARLSQLVGELEQRNHAMVLLNRWSGLLQQVHVLDEAVSISLTFLSELFARQTGALYLLDETGTTLEQAAAWGEPPYMPVSIAPETCWTFAGVRAHTVITPEEDLVCQHLGESADDTFPSICVQLLGRGIPLGLLHMCKGPRTRDERDSWEHLVVMVADLLSLAFSNLQMREDLRQQVTRDASTGLFNRRYLEETLERERWRAMRHQIPIGLILLALDTSVRPTSTDEHEHYSALLRAIGAFLRSNVRSEDVACRFAENEFMLVLPGANLEQTRNRARGMQQTIQQLVKQTYPEKEALIPVSAGIAIFPDHGKTAGALVQSAREALSDASSSNRQRLAVAVPEGETIA